LLAYSGIFGKQHITQFYSALKYAVVYITNYKLRGGLVIVHTWSLSVEEQFYLLWPGIVALVGLLKSRRFLFVAILLCPVIRLAMLAATHGNIDGMYAIGFSFETTCDSLATGCLLALTLTSIRKSRFYSWIMNTKVFAVIIAGIAGIQFLWTFTYGYPFIFYNTVGVSLLNIGIAICMIRWMDQPEKGIAKLLNTRPPMFLGRISYSIYLWQNIFMFNVIESKWTTFPFCIVWIAGAGLASFYLIEKPCFALRHYLDGRIFDQRKNKEMAFAASVR
jgi:peptidoglycan/LPS O-acetylase OafA/YrhL